jgi:hypothetical protein
MACLNKVILLAAQTLLFCACSNAVHGLRVWEGLYTYSPVDIISGFLYRGYSPCA